MRDFLKPMVSGSIHLGLVDNMDELNQVRKLKYQYLLKEFNQNIKMPNDMLIDDNDRRCDHIIAVDTSTNKVIATYRMVIKKHLLENEKFPSEEEFDLTTLKKERIVELSRACIHSDYRNGLVLMLMWQGMFQYCKENNIQYLFGTVSFAGTDISLYKHGLSYLYYNYLDENKFNIHAINTCDKLDQLPKEELNPILAKKELNTLVKGYLSLGCKVGDGVFIDSWFNSIDVFILLDIENCTSPLTKKIIKD